MSFFTPRNFAIGAGSVAAIAYIVPKLTGGKPIETFGSQNIADRYSAGGGSKTHLPGAATPRGEGNPDNVTSNQTNPKGVDTKHFKENHSDQKQDNSPAGKVWQNSMYGNDKGK
ncbi:unnamed protein product [Zymoseptoria tritici ST99CH_1A5]|uniref:Uncharacterized protein n=3 Tax=Zymoseptoria tritici TaxID=1047171 RepID=F9XGD6_ZYMTI|nr:uncharacterized protein MYCGRDRAFT_110048 [Zymoseptoria tritici IPO323]EGP86283.1 hypothetical protein MYCGRDRAFT_110048 [Zymoseptoria tritici IPO323]SMR54974.1 unnamed protein product [Zymoseptoria tritici ST99CH_1E4]SMR57356.1 unnamed protein product [Zymoseptoria tritici ST99CH_3D1]SMY25797.1 unnamed protein product [Zymoseptoria tritici ST99CH_1A5]